MALSWPAAQDQGMTAPTIIWTRTPGRWRWVSDTRYPASIVRRADGFHAYTPYWCGWLDNEEPEYGWMQPGPYWRPWRTLSAAQDAVEAHFTALGF
jgi:hypothetical protein